MTKKVIKRIKIEPHLVNSKEYVLSVINEQIEKSNKYVLTEKGIIFKERIKSRN